MNILLLCLFISALLPYIAKIPMVVAIAKNGNYDNNHPREQAGKLKGFGARAWAAHTNSFESLIVFGLAVLSAIASGHITDLTVNLAILYVVSRVVYHIVYLMNLATLRTLIWAVGYIASMTILGSCVF